MNRRLNLLVVLAALVGLLCSLRTSAAEDVGQVERFKIYGDGDVLLVPVEIEEKSHLFWIDTCNSKTAVDKSLISTKAIDEGRLKSFSGVNTVQLFEVPNARLRGFDLKTKVTSVIGMDLTMVRNVSGHEIMGIVGIDFLKDFAVEIDFNRGELILRSGKAEFDKQTQAIPINFNELQMPFVHAELPGWPGRIEFKLDTGLCDRRSGAIEKYTCNYLVKTGDMRGVGESMTQGAVGVIKNREFQGSNLTLGEHQVRNPQFSEADKNGNLLSLGFLSRFHVVMDFPNKNLYLKKGQAFDKPDLRDLSGIHVWKRENQVAVHSVDPSSIAEKAGLKADDVILKVDGQDVDQIRLFTLRQKLSQDGNAVNLAIKRGNQRMDMSIELRDLASKSQE